MVNRIGPSKADFRSKEIVLLISDFDDDSYCVKSQGDTFTVFAIIHSYQTYLKHCVEDYLQGVYSAEHFALDFNISTQQDIVYDFLSPWDQAESIADQVSCIKRNVLAGPFMWYFNASNEIWIITWRGIEDSVSFQ